MWSKLAMPRAPRIWFLALAAVAIALTASEEASANWVTIRNDTGTALVIQETVVVRGQVKRGRATNLLAGETHREFLPGPTVKRLEVFEASNPTLPVWSGSLTCKDDTQGFAVTVAGGKVAVSAIPSRK
jgi:hypothetical protein